MTPTSDGFEVKVEALPPATVQCSEGVLTSLVANVVRNALKYMGDAEVRCVTLSASDAGACWRVAVADTGPGIPDAKRNILFEPYVRGSSAEPGIGLGLATVKRLAEAHGGRVGVDSHPGDGATFWFELPKALSPESPPRLRM